LTLLYQTSTNPVRNKTQAIVRHKTRGLDVDLAAHVDRVRHDLLLAKVAHRVNDGAILHWLKLILKASGTRGVPQGGVRSPLLSHIYRTAVDAMLARAKAVMRHGAHTDVESVRPRMTWCSSCTTIVGRTGWWRRSAGGAERHSPHSMCS
jgi:RNA-directed DNA polymerase